MFAGRGPGLDAESGSSHAWLRLTPALVVVIPVLAVALGLGLAQSFGVFPLTGHSRFSLDAYRSLFSGQDLWRSLALTTYVSLTSTALALGLGVTVALVFRRLFSGSRVWAFLLEFNLPVPHLVGALAMILLLGQSGLLARIAGSGGLSTGPRHFRPLSSTRGESQSSPSTCGRRSRSSHLSRWVCSGRRPTATRL